MFVKGRLNQYAYSLIREHFECKARDIYLEFLSIMDDISYGLVMLDVCSPSDFN
jgi:hypothetical protein